MHSIWDITLEQVLFIAGLVDVIDGLRRLIWGIGPVSAMGSVVSGLSTLLVAGIIIGCRKYVHHHPRGAARADCEVSNG